MKEVLAACGVVRVMASEEDDGPIEVPSHASAISGSGGVEAGTEADAGTGFTVVFDPLDGSRNIEVSIPTGTSMQSPISSGNFGANVVLTKLDGSSRWMDNMYFLFLHLQVPYSEFMGGQG